MLVVTALNRAVGPGLWEERLEPGPALHYWLAL